MTTQLLHLRLEKELKEKLETIAKESHYSTTEFIREAIRQKINDEQIKQQIEKLRKLQGSVKNARLLTREERDEIAQEFFEQLLRKEKMRGKSPQIKLNENCVTAKDKINEILQDAKEQMSNIQAKEYIVRTTQTNTTNESLEELR